MAFLKHWGQMVALRVILGALDSGFFPTCVYLLSTWYPRCESTLPEHKLLEILICHRRGRQAILSLLHCGVSRHSVLWNPGIWGMVFSFYIKVGA